MTSSWTFSRKLALGFAVIAAAFAIVAVTGRTTRSLAASAETEAGATQSLQTSSQSTSPTSLTRLVEAT